MIAKHARNRKHNCVEGCGRWPCGELLQARNVVKLCADLAAAEALLLEFLNGHRVGFTERVEALLHERGLIK